MAKKMEKEKNIADMAIFYLKENIKMEKNGMEIVMILICINMN